MKKLFPTNSSLQIKPFEQIRYYGKYELEAVSKEHYQCILQSHRLQIVGENIEVQHLLDDGFLVSSSLLHKLVIERIEK
ncbi:MAG: RNA methyltransferase [Solibacillus sp.]|uniref:RNA methyltransferase n=1 Tax=unclassified Solibacillus TaxID=2637870 RepID=UPI0030FA5F75